jgi:hypothetical protein
LGTTQPTDVIAVDASATTNCPTPVVGAPDAARVRRITCAPGANSSDITVTLTINGVQTVTATTAFVPGPAPETQLQSYTSDVAATVYLWWACWPTAWPNDTVLTWDTFRVREDVAFVAALTTEAVTLVFTGRPEEGKVVVVDVRGLTFRDFVVPPFTVQLVDNRTGSVYVAPPTPSTASSTTRTVSRTQMPPSRSPSSTPSKDPSRSLSVVRSGSPTGEPTPSCSTTPSHEALGTPSELPETKEQPVALTRIATASPLAFTVIVACGVMVLFAGVVWGLRRYI